MAVISPDGQWLAAAGYGSFVRVWNLRTREPIGREFFGHEKIDGPFLFTPDGSRLLVGSMTGEVVVWDTSSGQQLRKWTVASSRVCNMAVSPDGELVATFGLDDKLKVWELASGEEVYSLPGDGFLGGKGALSFTADGEYLALWGDHKNRLQVFRTRTGEQVRDYSTEPEKKPDDKSSYGYGEMDFGTAHFSPDARLLTISKMGGQTVVWEIASEERLTDLYVPNADWYRAVMLPASESVALLCRGPGQRLPLPNGGFKTVASEDFQLQIHDLRSGKLVRRIPLEGGRASSYDISPDGRHLVVSQSIPYGLAVYDFESGRPLGTMLTDSMLPGRPMFSPDGRRIATTSGGNFLIWDLEQLLKTTGEK